MTLGEVFRFEVEYRLRQPSTLVYALVLFGIPFLLMHAIDGSSQLLNAPSQVALISTVLGGVSMLITAGVFGDAAARDVEMRIYSLFYTSPAHKSQYLLGRYLGALVVNGVLVLGIPLGLLLASIMPYMPDGKFGPVQLMAYVQTYVLVLLPNVAIIGAFMFAAAAITRQSLATYLGGIALYALGTVSGDLTNGFDSNTLTVLVDPFGSEAVQTAIRGWTPAEADVRLMGWPAMVFLNRALWLGVAAGVLSLLVARFRFAHQGAAGRRKWWRRRQVIDTAPDRVVLIDAPEAPPAQREFSAAARVRQTLEVAARMWREIAATRSFLVILVGALCFVFAAGWDVGAEMFGTSTWPVTHLIAGTVLSTALGPVMAILIAIFAGELVWRERDVNIGDIAAVAPIPNSVALFGRFLALVAMLVTLQAVLMGAGMLLQAVRGYDRFEIDVYLKLLFGVKLVDYVLLAALAMAIHVIVNHKYIGHLVFVLYFAYTLSSGMLGIRHRMLVYSGDPGWIWSDMNGLAPFVQGLVWFKLYWAAWALLLAVLANLFWVRGRQRGVKQRLSLARQRLVGPALRAATLAVVLIVTLGGFVLYNTNVLNVYRSPDVAIGDMVEYERRYKRYAKAPEPTLVNARMNVELYPSERAAELRGTFRLVNRTAVPIDTLHMVTSVEVQTRVLEFDRAARLVVNDSALRYRIYALERTLAPGDTIAMTFDVAFRPRGFRNDGAPTSVTSNGAYVNAGWVPSFGYSAGREITDTKLRAKHGLPPRELPPSAGDVETSGAEQVPLVYVETTIGTDSQQVAVTPGTLVREWRDKGRRYFQYRTDAPIRYSGAVLSAKYAVSEGDWNGLPLRVYHHPGHEINVERMIGSMKASLSYFSKQFSPYQYKELRIVEFPRYTSNATAHPFTIAFSEGGAFLTRIDSGVVDRTFFVVAHETAHQWWGGQVIPAQAAGAAMVSESLAQYSAMMVLETTYGLDMAKEFYDYNMQEYFRGRTVFTNREVPLLDVYAHPYLHYFKGGVVMYSLRERLGADVVNGALRSFRDKYSGTGAPPATSRALYAELKAVTPDTLQPFLSDLFEHITLWNVHADSARAERVGNEYRVSLFVDASKARADSIGNQTPMAMDEPVEIGVFAGDPTSHTPGEQLYLKQHRIRSGKQTIVITVPKMPSRAGIDPLRKLIETNRDDNVSEIPQKLTEGGKAG